ELGLEAEPPGRPLRRRPGREEHDQEDSGDLAPEDLCRGHVPFRRWVNPIDEDCSRMRWNASGGSGASYKRIERQARAKPSSCPVGGGEERRRSTYLTPRFMP